MVISIFFIGCETKYIDGLKDGKACNDNSECQSGYCDKVCKNKAQIDDENIKKENGEFCIFDDDCRSNNCGLTCEPNEKDEKIESFFTKVVSILLYPFYIILYIIKIILMPIFLVVRWLS